MHNIAMRTVTMLGGFFLVSASGAVVAASPADAAAGSGLLWEQPPRRGCTWGSPALHSGAHAQPASA